MIFKSIRQILKFKKRDSGERDRVWASEQIRWFLYHEEDLGCHWYIHELLSYYIKKYYLDERERQDPRTINFENASSMVYKFVKRK